MYGLQKQFGKLVFFTQTIIIEFYAFKRFFM